MIDILVEYIQKRARNKWVLYTLYFLIIPISIALNYQEFLTFLKSIGL